MRSKIVAFALALPYLSSATEVTDSTDSTDYAYNLNEVVITGTRTPKLLKDTPVPTRLISSEEIRRADATNLSDLLQTEMPGVEFSYAMNQQVNMNLAGFSGQSVLILYDGERLAGETMDNVDFSRLSMNNIGRIEIIRGAASALYGSNATGGVINIIPKNNVRSISSSVDLRAGSHGEARAGAAVGVKIKKFSNTLDANFYRIDSYNVCDDLTDQCDFRRVYGHYTYNVNDRFTFSPSTNVKISARAGYYFKERYCNPDIPDRYRDISAGVRSKWQINDNNNIEVSYSFDQYDKSDYIKLYKLDLRDYSNKQQSAKLLYTLTSPNLNSLIIGADYLSDKLDSYQFADGKSHSQQTADVFGQYDWNLTENLELVGALRWDWYSENNANFLTPKLSLRYKLNSFTLRAGYATGFRAPSLKEKYMDFDMANIFDIHGNPALKPEKSHNFSVSAERSYKNFYFSLAANYNIVKNRISTSTICYDENDSPFIYYLNVPEIYVLGADATIRARWNNGLSASISYNFTHEHDPVHSPSQYCPARPHAMTARANWTHCWKDGFDFDVDLSGRFLSSIKYEAIDIKSFEATTHHNPSYFLCKLQASQSIFESFQIIASIDNLLNYKPTIYSFNSPVTSGRTFTIGLNWNFNK